MEGKYLADFEVFKSNPTSEINDWVKRKTRGNIEKLVGKPNISKNNIQIHQRIPSFWTQHFYFFIAEDVSESVELLLTNALYFKDAWTKPFEVIPTHIGREFTLRDGSKVNVSSKMMYRDSTDFLLVSNLTLNKLEDERHQFTVLSMPYTVSNHDVITFQRMLYYNVRI